MHEVISGHFGQGKLNEAEICLKFEAATHINKTPPQYLGRSKTKLTTLELDTYI